MELPKNPGSLIDYIPTLDPNGDPVSHDAAITRYQEELLKRARQAKEGITADEFHFMGPVRALSLIQSAEPIFSLPED